LSSFSAQKKYAQKGLVEGIGYWISQNFESWAMAYPS